MRVAWSEGRPEPAQRSNMVPKLGPFELRSEALDTERCPSGLKSAPPTSRVWPFNAASSRQVPGVAFSQPARPP